MSKLRQGGIRTGEPMLRTTLTIDADTAAALSWLRSAASADRVSASRLLRDAAREALAAQGRTVMLGEVVAIEAPPA